MFRDVPERDGEVERLRHGTRGFSRESKNIGEKWYDGG